MAAVLSDPAVTESQSNGEFRPLLATLPPKVDPGAFSGQRLGWNTAKRTLWQCTASVCVVGSALLRDLLGLSRSRERDLSVLSIYPRIFLRVFIVYRLLVGFLFVLLYSAIC